MLFRSDHQLLIRELILQFKKGYLDLPYYREKYGVDIGAEWQSVWKDYEEQGLITRSPARVDLTRKGLLQVDGLLPGFFEPQHRGVRYT